MVTSFWQWNPYFWIKKFSRTSLVYLSRPSFIWHFSGQGSFKFVFVMPIWRHCEHLDHTCMGWRRIFIHLWKQKSQGRSGIISIPKTLPSLGSIKSQNIRSNWRPSYECKGFFFLLVCFDRGYITTISQHSGSFLIGKHRVIIQIHFHWKPIEYLYLIFRIIRCWRV